MNSRERILMTLNHKEPDRVPFDLASTHVTSINVGAYENLCRYLGVDAKPILFSDAYQQVVVPNQAILDRLQVDTRGLFPLTNHNWKVEGEDKGEYHEFVDEWGFTQRFPKEDGHWWSLVKSPLDSMIVEPDQIKSYPWPDPEMPERIAGLRAQAEQYRAEGKIVMLKGFCAGLFEMGQRVRGMENFLIDLMTDPDSAGLILDSILDLKVRFWEMALAELGDVVDIVVEGDDYGTQESQLISYKLYKKLIAPRLEELIRTLKTTFAEKKRDGGKPWAFFHSCGSVRPFLPDFIEMGVDILNPVHISAAGMEPGALKKDFGDAITFWGGGVETQSILPNGTPEQVREDVKRNVEALMPGGGFVFNTVHNIQGEVPPENIMAMWEALQECGRYS